MSEEFLAIAGEMGAVRSLLAANAGQGSKHLSAIVDQPDATILVGSGARFIRLPGDAGVLVGRLFAKDNQSSPVYSLDDAQTRAAVCSNGRSLIDRYWGHYIAILRTGEGIALVRDPSGAVPAYFHDLGHAQLFCSQLDLAEGLAGGPEVDEPFLLQWLAYPFLRTARTGLAGWTEILPGSCQRSFGQPVNVWTPAAALSSSPCVLQFEDAARLIRKTALSTVGRLVQDLSFPILELSGGLDSSIVAACLHAQKLDFKAANFATSAPDGNERSYAQLVATHFGIELFELEEDEEPLDLRPARRPAFRPALSPVLQPLDRAREKLAGSIACDSFVTGAGGDNIFCYLATAAPILDAASELGLAKSWQTLGHVAELGECTMFKAARYAFLKMVARRFRPSWPSDRRFMAAEIPACPPEFHPWLGGLDHLPVGKAEHVEALVRAQHFLEAQYCWGGEVRHPLLNQPLIEACLSIPTWLWVDGGRNRAVARAAFEDLLPKVTVNRRSKGRLESMCAKAFADHRPRLAELLLGGKLAARCLIDREALEAYLISPEPPRDDGYFRIFDLCSLELWLRSLERWAD